MPKLRDIPLPLRRAFLLSCGMALGAVLAVIAAEEKPPAEATVPALKELELTAGTLDLDQGDMTQFWVLVPDDAVMMTVRVTEAPVPLEIIGRAGQAMANSHDAEHHSNPDDPERVLNVSRQTVPPLESGMYFVAVAHTDRAPLIANKRPIFKVPFKIEVSFLRARTDAVLKPGSKRTGQVRDEDGSVRTFAIDVPESAEVLRIDLDDVSSDLDLLARYEKPIVDNNTADETAIGPLGRESLVIDKHSEHPLRPGRWYVNVVHPVDYGTADFTIHVSLQRDPPAPLLAIPPLPTPDEPRKRAIVATVEVATENGAASGTLLTDAGLVLTNYHVIAEVATAPPETSPVVLAATLDPRRPPRELFRGRVVAFEKKADLALVQITGGFFNQPLPKDYRFPTIPLGDSEALDIGDPIYTLGFPSVGGTVGRVSVTHTRGVVSGFEKMPVGTLIKTDAAISPGSSGGAALDSQWRLIGVPTSENIDPEVVGRMSFVHPLALLPKEWRAKIGK